jgi:hypothetical protein
LGSGFRFTFKMRVQVQIHKATLEKERDLNRAIVFILKHELLP